MPLLTGSRFSIVLTNLYGTCTTQDRGIVDLVVIRSIVVLPSAQVRPRLVTLPMWPTIRAGLVVRS